MSAYYRFPIYLLGLPGEPPERINAICDWCVMNAGHEFSFDSAAAKEKYNGLEIAKTVPWEKARWDHRNFHVGKKLLGVSGGTLSDFVDNHQRCQTFVSNRSSTWGSPSFASVGSGLFWEQFHTQHKGAPGLSWRLFTALCAVNCAVGNKTHPFPVTRDFLRAAAVGFKSPKGLFRPDGGPTKLAMDHVSAGLEFHTVRQMRDDLDQLEAQGLIGRIPVSRRVMAFFLPHQCQPEQALEWLAKKTVKKERPNELRQKAFEILEKARKGQS